jgi:hypothetical protein
MSLYQFLKSQRQTVARERILYTKACLDLSVYAGSHSAQIQFTEPDVDNEGYDFTAVYNYLPLYIQNKSRFSDSKTRVWKIHTSLLRVNWLNRDIAPKIDGVAVVGASNKNPAANGCVLLHVVDAQSAKRNELKVQYFYFDLYLCSAIAQGYLKRNSFSAKKAQSVLRRVRDDCEQGMVRIPQAAFLPVQSAAAVLGLRFSMGTSNYISALSAGGSADPVGKRLWLGSVQPWATDGLS